VLEAAPRACAVRSAVTRLTFFHYLELTTASCLCQASDLRVCRSKGVVKHGDPIYDWARAEPLRDARTDVLDNATQYCQVDSKTAMGSVPHQRGNRAQQLMACRGVSRFAYMKITLM
jgi:hypothetical protein